MRRHPADRYFIRGEVASPHDWRLRTDLSCPRCGAHMWEHIGDGDFRFSCINYWRDEHGAEHCWTCACPESACQPPQLSLF